MPSCKKSFSYRVLLALWLWGQCCLAGEFSPQIRRAALLESPTHYSLDADIEYQLSGIAREALDKGVPLTWKVAFKIEQSGWLLDSDIYSQKLRYQLQYHALLKQYEVKTPSGNAEMFLSLHTALSFMSLLHDAQPIAKDTLKTGKLYKLALKSQFIRESLPVPMRPFTYLDPQWALSSDWFVWSIQK